ncbi:hypothetical protein LCGC14_3138210, partial [marine sediment metagenome]
ECISGCYRRPGWMTPAEARALIDAGHSDKLMLECWLPTGYEGEEVQLLAVAVRGSESGIATFDPCGCCTFLSSGERCEIYELRPLECALSVACDDERTTEAYLPQLVVEVYEAWQPDDSQALVDEWKEAHDVEGEAPAGSLIDAFECGIRQLFEGSRI